MIALSFSLTALPLWVNTLLVVVLTTMVAACGPLLIRRAVGLEGLSANNEVAGFKFAVLGVIYAVLLGFAVIVVWEKFRDAEEAVAQEGSSLVAVYRLSQGLEAGQGDALRAGLDQYVRVAIAHDWPAMAAGHVDVTTGRTLTGIYRAVLKEDPHTPAQTLAMDHLLNGLDSIASARRERLLLASGVVPGVLWATLLVGGVITIGFTFFFGSPSLRAQALMTGMLASLIFMALLVVVEIDHPFTGPVSVTPEALILAQEAFRD